MTKHVLILALAWAAAVPTQVAEAQSSENQGKANSTDRFEESDEAI